MKHTRFLPLGFLVLPISAFVLQGCGGGGGGSAQATPVPSNVPTATTKSDVSTHFAGIGQSVVTASFSSYGPKLKILGQFFFDSGLGLWGRVRLGSSKLQEDFFLDQAGTNPAGNLLYNVSDVTKGESGSFTITQGRFAGLSGTYSETLQATGHSGNVNYTVPNMGTTVCQFSVQFDQSGNAYGNGSTAVALQNGYSQTEQITYNADGSQIITTSDGNKCNGTFNLFADTSGSGVITGSDPGLPAQLSWDRTGSGHIEFADGSVSAVTNWQLPSTQLKRRSH